jgi:hypothetical protein
MATPTWSAARSGLLGDTGAVNASEQVNQFLGTHGITPVYQGSSILTPNGSGGEAWKYPLATQDVSQPFVMSGTTIGRVVVPLLAVGQGADLVVSLYTDSSGTPGSLLTQTRIPAGWITSLSAVAGVAGPASSAPTVEYTGNPLALAQFNALRTGTPWASTPYTLAAGGAGGAALPAVTSSSGFYILAGGEIGAVITGVVSTIARTGDGVLAPPVLQPSLPQPTAAGGVAATSDTVVFVGGWDGSSLFDNVWTASWDASTGTIGAWSAQAPLPQPLIPGIVVASGSTVYVIAGMVNVSGTLTTAVYYGQVQNGQIGAWNTGPAYPLALQNLYAFAANGFLVVVGGETFAGASVASVYYAAIHADGSLGAWQVGPSLPTAANTDPVGANLAFTPHGGVVVGGFITVPLQSLTIEANGPGMWQTQTPTSSVTLGNNMCAAFESGDGTWDLFSIYPGLSEYWASSLNLTPQISVPLPATGLTNGATYHVILQQAGGTPNDFLRLSEDVNAFPSHPTLLTRAAGSSSWVAGTTGHEIPISIYDNSTTGPLWHLYDDGGERITTVVQATTPNQPVLGVLEATAQPGAVMNQTPVFTNGLGQWHATGATFTQSSAHTHGNLPVSGLLTPSGADVLSYAESDLVPVQQGHSYVLTAWYFSPTGYSDVNLSANWFDSTRTYLSTSAGTPASIPANSWTQFTTTVTDNVAGAVFLDLVVVQGSTPPSSALLFVSAATLQDTSGPMLSTVTQVTYGGTWPSPSAWPPLGLTTPT